MKNYFKKFSIMFVMALVIIGSAMIQNGSVANAATVGKQLLQPESGWRRIDDADNGISYAGNWEVFKSDGHYYNSTFHNSWSKGNTMVFKFYGTKLRIIGDIYNNKSSNIDIKIDANTENINEYSSSLAQFQTIVYERLDLPLATHTVTITTNDNADVVIDALDVDDTGYLMNPNESITLDKSTMNLTQGDSGQLTATTTPAGAQVIWKSSDSSVVTVDSAGKVTAAKEGTCTITATTADGLTATCTVTVTKETKSISLNKSTTNLTINDSETLIATTTPAGISVKWSSSDTSVATVDSNGKVTAIGTGTATIIATTLDGSNLSASCLVTVAPKGNDPTAGSEYITNIAHAKGDNTNNAGGDVTIIFHGTADTTLSVVKTADVKDVWVGDNFTYTLVITNTGTKTAKAVVVKDPTPNHIDFNVSGVITTQGSVDSSSTAKNIIVNVGDILPGGTVTIKIPSTVIA